MPIPNRPPTGGPLTLPKGPRAPLRIPNGTPNKNGGAGFVPNVRRRIERAVKNGRIR